MKVKMDEFPQVGGEPLHEISYNELLGAWPAAEQRRLKRHLELSKDDNVGVVKWLQEINLNLLTVLQKMEGH